MPLQVDTRKAVALLAYLAVSGSPASRDQLAMLLWPEVDGDRARATLRRTLSALRAGLAGRWLVADRLRVTLGGEGRASDFERVALLAAGHRSGPGHVCAACIADLEEAASLYRGPFMAGFTIRDSPDFEDWQRSQEEWQQRQLRDILDRLAGALAATGRYLDGAEAARRRLALDPLDESGHRQLMQLLAWNGDRAGALRQYRECAAILDRELGVGPLPETRRLYEQVAEGREPSPSAIAAVAFSTAPAPGVPDPRTAPFQGRAAELSRLRSASAPLIVVVGEEGIGKTRLIDQWLSGESRPIARTAAPPGASSIPYLAIRDALAAAAERAQAPPPLAAAEAVRLLPELIDHGFSPPGPPDDSPGAMTRFHAGVAAALTHLLPGGVLVIDDAQWLDESSTAMVSFLLTHRSEGVPQLVVALREEALTRDHELLLLIRRMVRSGTALRLEVGALSEAEARALLADRSGPDADGDRIDRILAVAGGNPLFLLAYVDAAGSNDQDLPPGLDELVSARIEGLDEAAQQLLAAAAVVGQEVDADTLRAVSGRSEEEMVSAVEQMVQRRLLRETPSGVAFGHEVVRNAVYRRMSTARRRALHGRAAAALRQRGVPASYADHLERAGRSQESALAHAVAGQQALTLFAYPEARYHLGAALSLGHPDRPALNVMLGDAALRMGEYGEALAAYEAVGVAGTSAEVEHRIGEVYRRLGRLQLADTAYQAAASLATDPALAARIAADRALVAHHQGDADRARSLAATALDLAGGDEATLAQAWNLAGMLAVDPKEALIRLEKAVAMAEGTGRSDVAAAAYNNLALALRRSGDHSGAVGAARKALILLEPVGDRHQLAALHSNLADALHAAGDDERAREHLTKSARLFAEVGVETGQWEPEIWKLSEW